MSEQAPTPRSGARSFLPKALNGPKAWETPTVINTDKAPTYGPAVAELKAEGKCPEETEHRQVKYLSNVVESDHGKLKQLIRSAKAKRPASTSPATCGARRASSNAPSTLDPVCSPRPSSSSASNSNFRRRSIGGDVRNHHLAPAGKLCNRAVRLIGPCRSSAHISPAHTLRSHNGCPHGHSPIV